MLLLCSTVIRNVVYDLHSSKRQHQTKQHFANFRAVGIMRSVEKNAQLLQFLICKEFREAGQDRFSAESIHSNIYTSEFPVSLDEFYVVTCWQKDEKFHKEVIEYQTDYGAPIRTPHMDIERITDSVLFRWHKHPFPAHFMIEKPTLLTIRVILDTKPLFESHILIEKKP